MSYSEQPQPTTPPQVDYAAMNASLLRQAIDDACAARDGSNYDLMLSAWQQKKPFLHEAFHRLIEDRLECLARYRTAKLP